MFLSAGGMSKICSCNFSLWGIEGNKRTYGNKILHHKPYCTGNTRRFIVLGSSISICMYIQLRHLKPATSLNVVAEWQIIDLIASHFTIPYKHFPVQDLIGCCRARNSYILQQNSNSHHLVSTLIFQVWQHFFLESSLINTDIMLDFFHSNSNLHIHHNCPLFSVFLH